MSKLFPAHQGRKNRQKDHCSPGGRSPITRAGIRATLTQTSDLQIVGKAQNGIEVQQIVAEFCPRILLLDLRMPELAPAKLEKWVRENHPETITLILTQHDRDSCLAKMMDAGVAGYLSKEASSNQLIGAIRCAATRGFLFTNEQFERVRQWRETAGQKVGKSHRTRTGNTQIIDTFLDAVWLGEQKSDSHLCEGTLTFANLD